MLEKRLIHCIMSKSLDIYVIWVKTNFIFCNFPINEETFESVPYILCVCVCVLQKQLKAFTNVMFQLETTYWLFNVKQFFPHPLLFSLTKPSVKNRLKETSWVPYSADLFGPSEKYKNADLFNLFHQLRTKAC
jgi:hypothetical protein